MTSAGSANERLPLTRERILREAVGLVDKHGVEGLTMRRLGALLGVEAMSIYNHVPNKAALVDGIVELVVGEIEIPPGDQDWRKRLKSLARSYRQMALRHPRFVPLLAMRPFSATPALEPVEVIFEALGEAGLDPPAVVDTYRVMAAFALGYTMTEAAMLLADDAEATGGVAAALEHGLSEYPNIARAAPYLLKADPVVQFEYGLDVLIAGLESKLGEN